MTNVTIVAAACALAAILGAPTAPADRDHAEILAAVQRFFDGIAAHDPVKLSADLLPGGQVRSVREDKGQWVVRTNSFEESVKSIAGNTSRMLERMWKPEVRVYGRIATVAAPYDFHVDGVFSHCGTDVFTLVKTPEGWKVSSILYTVERQGCKPSPLGPPR
jgi:hypothetical protein